MEIAIINKSDLNNCWSSLQYTNHCEMCSKILDCKICSRNRLEGLKRYHKSQIKSMNMVYKYEKDKIDKTCNSLIEKISKSLLKTK